MWLSLVVARTHEYGNKTPLAGRVPCLNIQWAWIPTDTDDPTVGSRLVGHPNSLEIPSLTDLLFRWIFRLDGHSVLVGPSWCISRPTVYFVSLSYHTELSRDIVNILTPSLYQTKRVMKQATYNDVTFLHHTVKYFKLVLVQLPIQLNDIKGIGAEHDCGGLLKCRI